MDSKRNSRNTSLGLELGALGCRVVQQPAIKVKYKGVVFGEYFADLGSVCCGISADRVLRSNGLSTAYEQGEAICVFCVHPL